MKKTINLTAAGKIALENELATLVNERPAIAERIATARAFGDLSENEEYSSARNEQKIAETRIAKIQEILKKCKIIAEKTYSQAVVGASVTIKLGDKEQTYSIVGPVEANPLEGRISDQSPIGKALLGLKTGESFKLPNGQTGKILSIN